VGFAARKIPMMGSLSVQPDEDIVARLRPLAFFSADV
jgi:hypothetical protein